MNKNISKQKSSNGNKEVTVLKVFLSLESEPVIDMKKVACLGQYFSVSMHSTSATHTGLCNAPLQLLSFT
jgi:hypothetical protein